MKKIILTILSVFCSLPAFAMLYTTHIEGDSVTYLPPAGSIVKKGEPLAKYDTSDIDLIIKELEESVKEGKECNKDAKTDIARAKSLKDKHVISVSSYENIECLYKCCSLKVKSLELDLEYYKLKQKRYTITAPFDCKIVKRIICVGSALEYGEPVLEIEKL